MLAGLVERLDSIAQRYLLMMLVEVSVRIYSPIYGARHPVDHRKPSDCVDELRRRLSLEQQNYGPQLGRIVEVSSQRNEEIVDSVAGEVRGQNHASVGPVVLPGVLEGTVFASNSQLQTTG